MSALPRGIRVVRWTNADGSVSVRYRVRIERKDFKADNLYEDLAEAVLFLNLTKSNRGRQALSTEEQHRKTELEKKEKELIAKWVHEKVTTRLFKHSLATYKQEHVDTLPDEEELDARKKSNLQSFLRTIQNTKISVDGGSALSPIDLSKFSEKSKPFSEFETVKLGPIDINKYIEARLKLGRKKSTVSREVSIISQIIENDRGKFKEIAAIPNPALNYNKKLLANKPTKKKVRLSKEDYEKIMLELDTYPNPHMKKICKFALATACRRSEIINLRWDWIQDTHIEFPRSKTGPRNVYLTQEALEILGTVQKESDEPRVFNSYSTIAGFEGSFSKFMERIGLKHITFHVFRKTAFSIFYDALGDENSTLIAQFLGVRSVRKMDELHAPRIPKGFQTAKDIQRSGGHSSAEVANKHYYTPDFKQATQATEQDNE
ncbi:integrase [Variovorax sp. W2I14]